MLKSKNSGRKIIVKVLILAIILSPNFEIMNARMNPKIQNGVNILYSKIPKNLLE